MDFSWTPEQIAFKERVLEFSSTLVSDGLAERDRVGEFAQDAWRRCADFGIQSYAIPAAYNSSGVDTDFLTAVLAMEAIGMGCEDNGLHFALSTHMWTVAHPIARFGTEDQKRELLPSMCDGSFIGAHALTEPDTGSDSFGLQTTATRTNGGYLLTGEKRFITLGPIADVFLLFATTDPALGKWAVTAFLVDAKSDGLEVGEVRHKMGLRTVPMADVTLRECFVPESRRLGAEGSGVSISNNCLELERCSILASQLGAMDRQLERSIEYAKTRQQFGQAIGKYQSVSNRIADMKLRLETARLLLYKTAWMRQNGQPAMVEAALLKLHISECFVSSSLDAIRTHGGLGYISDYGVERDLRDAVGGVLYAGTTDIQRHIVARLLGL